MSGFYSRRSAPRPNLPPRTPSASGWGPSSDADDVVYLRWSPPKVNQNETIGRKNGALLRSLGDTRRVQTTLEIDLPPIISSRPQPGHVPPRGRAFFDH